MTGRSIDARAQRNFSDGDGYTADGCASTRDVRVSCVLCRCISQLWSLERHPCREREEAKREFVLLTRME